MTKKFKIAVAALFVIAASAVSVNADEVQELKKQLAEQSLLLKKLENRLNQIESHQAEQEKIVDEKISQVQTTQNLDYQIPPSLEWASKINISGDFRYRHETINKDSGADRTRHRIRFRLGLDGKINDQWKFGMRLATGSDDPVSTNQTLGDTFSTKDIRLDRAFVTWTPGFIDGTEMMFGKFGVPFYKPGKTELIWDGDLSVEGIAATHKFNVNDNLSAWATAAGLWVDEASGDVDPAMFGGQIGFKQQINEDSHLIAGGSFFGYSNVEGSNLFGDDTFGNTPIGGDPEVLQYGYEIMELFAELGTNLNGVPVSIFADYANNTASGVSEDTAWLIGAQYNKAKSPGTWQLSYNYRDVEADAVLGVLTDSDFIGGGTNGSGHEFGFKYAIAKNFFAGLTYFVNDIDRSGDRGDFDRLQLDLEYKF